MMTVAKKILTMATTRINPKTEQTTDPTIRAIIMGPAIKLVIKPIDVMIWKIFPFCK